MRYLVFCFFVSGLAAQPLHFEPNRGQVKGRTEWTAGVGGAHVFLAGNEAKFGDVHMRMVGARRIGKLEGMEPTGGYSSYFVGRDEKSWVTGVPHFARVRQRSVYPGIDVVYYASDRNVEYDFLVAPGADPKRIELAFDKPVRVDANGDLVLGGGVRQHRPRVFRDGREIAAEYRITSRGHVEIALADHDRSRSLTIDPVVEFATYLGGSGFDHIARVLVDSSGNLVIGGDTQSPAAPGLDPFQQPSISYQNPFVMKLTPDGRRVIFFAQLGTTGYTLLVGFGMDALGNLALTGKTQDPKFPLKNPFQTEYVSVFGRGYVTKLAADGRSLVFSTYLGGSEADTGSRVVFDRDGNLYAVGQTQSKDFPVRNAFQSKFSGASDGYVTKFNSAGNVLFSTFFGGSGLDSLTGPILSRDGSLLFAGTAIIADLPMKNAMQTSASPGNFGAPFLMRMSTDGQTLIQCSYVGGEDFTGSTYAIDEDLEGNIYIGMRAWNPFFTLKNPFQANWRNDSTSALLKLDPAGKIVFGTFFDGMIINLATDPEQNVYVSGYAGPDLPLKHSLGEFSGTRMNYLSKFTSSGQSLAFSTVIPGTGLVSGGPFALDPNGAIYLSGTTASTDFPVKNAYQAKYGGGAADAFLIKIIDDSAASVSPLGASPARLSFQYVQGGPLPVPQTVSVSGPEQYFLTTSPNWISAAPAGSPSPLASVRITVDPAGLAPGNYTGTVVLHPQSGANVATIDVSLTVLGPAPVITSVDPALVPVGADDTPITIHGSGFKSGASLFFNAVAYGIIPITVVDSNTITFTLPKLLISGEYTYSVTVQNPSSPQSNAIALDIGKPGPAVTAVQNAASYAAPPIAVGEIITVYGSNFGTMETTQVTFDNTPARLIYVTPSQLAVTVPRTLANPLKASLMVAVSQIYSAPVVLDVRPSAPGLFTADSSGKGQASALNQDFGINGPTNPAERGSVIQLFGTGGGLLTRDALPQVTLPISATIDGIDSVVQFAGAAPGLPEGVLQVNLFIPSGARSGNVPVVIKIGDTVSNAPTLALR